MDEVWVVRDDSVDGISDIYAIYRNYEDALHDFNARCEELDAKIQNIPWDENKKNSKCAITNARWYIILEPVQFV